LIIWLSYYENTVLMANDIKQFHTILLLCQIFDADLILELSRNIVNNLIESCGLYRFCGFITSVKHTTLKLYSLHSTEMMPWRWVTCNIKNKKSKIDSHVNHVIYVYEISVEFCC